MEPILLVHGYSTDANSEPNRDSVVGMYGNLPKWLRSEYGRKNVFELNVSRYISLEDGIGMRRPAVRVRGEAVRRHRSRASRGLPHVRLVPRCDRRTPI